MLPSEEEIRCLLLKYIAGETTEKESKDVSDWLKEHPEAFKEFEQLWDLWYAVGTATNVFQINVDKGWNDTLLKIRESNGEKKQKRSVRKIIIWSSSITATILLLIGVSFLHSHNKNGRTAYVHTTSDGLLAPIKEKKDTVHSRYETRIQTLPEERRKVKLPDGSEVWLNGRTFIHFYVDEKKQKRILYLKGQAFFNIVHQAGQPFVIKTKYAMINVLGTRFNVSAYPEDSAVKATLTSGRILFETKNHHQLIKKQIQPGQQIAINYLSGRLEVSTVDTVFYTSWKEGKIIFQNQYFKEVAKAMEHKYNVHILFKTPALKYKKINGYFQKESLTEALTALKLTLQFQYKLKGDSVIIYE